MSAGARITELATTVPIPALYQNCFFEMKRRINLGELGLEYSTPLAMMTIGQLVDVIQSTEPKKEEKGEEFVYGLRGIRELFGVSHKTAQAYKNTFLAPACDQLGRTIIVDRKKAIELFKETGRAYNGR